MIRRILAGLGLALAALVAACSSNGGSSASGQVPPAASTPAASSAPVSTPAAPEAAATCVMGYEKTAKVTFGNYGSSYPGPFRTGKGHGGYDDRAYRLTVINDGSAPLTVEEFAVNITPSGSDSESPTGWVIPPGQSGTFTELADTSMNGTGGPGQGNDSAAGVNLTYSGAGIPNNASACQLANNAGPNSTTNPGMLISASGGGRLLVARGDS